MLNLVRKFAKDKKGATAIEYGLIAGLMAVALLSGYGLLAGSVENVLTDLSNTIQESDDKIDN